MTRLREEVRRRLLSGEAPAQAISLAEALARAGGSSVSAVLFFGSRKSGAKTDVWSAYDFFVLTEPGTLDYYRSLARSGACRRSPWLLAALNMVLPPNLILYRAPRSAGESLLAKCAVISLRAFEHETSSGRRDHFCAGRMFQPTSMVYASEAALRDRVVEAVVAAHVLTADWGRPWLPGSFGVEEYCRTLLRVSLAGEIRPEPAGRADALFEAQREYLLSAYRALLLDLVDERRLERVDEDEFRFAAGSSGPLARGASRAYFAWSKARATLRWLKYVVTVEGWLDYIVRKAERHSGERIVLTHRERRAPLVFLWPRVVRFLRRKRTGE